MEDLQPTTDRRASKDTPAPTDSDAMAGAVPFERLGAVSGTRGASGECFYTGIDGGGGRRGADGACDDPYEAGQAGGVSAGGWQAASRYPSALLPAKRGRFFVGFGLQARKGGGMRRRKSVGKGLLEEAVRFAVAPRGGSSTAVGSPFGQRPCEYSASLMARRSLSSAETMPELPSPPSSLILRRSPITVHKVDA